MNLIADIFLAAGAIGAAVYCYVLGRRLNRFNDLEKGVGGAVAVLSAQVDDLNRTLAAAQQTAAGSAQTLTDLTTRAEDMSRRLELQMAALHDVPPVPEQQSVAPTAPPPPASSATPMFARRPHSTTQGDIA
ncbi:hypothetical protein OS189_05410 [Sulfitobacter sp. F26169L]|uniref:hypothetical protein n=1 Tax=Sulfitobacter sp. F26169L TaxID=2996015 RepID=UPI002260D395|nr:hypothetical protein [Sulfitobacter sp. F26169L]MCX7565772.1 hypothetical protein [Sulfitobacter sp. F26169L]